MSARVSPVSKVSSVLIVAVGIFMVIAGLVGGTEANTIAGLAFVTLGVVLYVLLYRLGRRRDAKS
ncbi:MAG: hypothetical protein HY247_05120 [archaeon]|nr:MAG: hypothetical protein HY247_05120 [archaeon]